MQAVFHKRTTPDENNRDKPALTRGSYFTSITTHCACTQSIARAASPVQVADKLCNREHNICFPCTTKHSGTRATVCHVLHSQVDSSYHTWSKYILYIFIQLYKWRLLLSDQFIDWLLLEETLNSFWNYEQRQISSVITPLTALSIFVRQNALRFPLLCFLPTAFSMRSNETLVYVLLLVCNEFVLAKCCYKNKSLAALCSLAVTNNRFASCSVTTQKPYFVQRSLSHTATTTVLLHSVKANVGHKKLSCFSYTF